MADTKDQAPRLVKADGERITPADAPLTVGNAMEMFKALLDANRASQVEAAQIQAEAFQNAQLALAKKLQEEAESEDQKALKTFKNRSAFNPRGENALVDGTRPRPRLHGEVLWVGTPVVWHEQTREGIDLLSQLQPGVYHDGEWVVRDMEPGVKGSRKLYVHFPNLDPDTRASLPTSRWDFNAKDEDGVPLVGQDLTNPTKKGRLVTGMEEMLREMGEEAAARQAVPA